MRVDGSYDYWLNIEYWIIREKVEKLSPDGGDDAFEKIFSEIRSRSVFITGRNSKKEDIEYSRI